MLQPLWRPQWQRQCPQTETTVEDNSKPQQDNRCLYESPAPPHSSLHISWALRQRQRGSDGGGGGGSTGRQWQAESDREQNNAKGFDKKNKMLYKQRKAKQCVHFRHRCLCFQAKNKRITDNNNNNEILYKYPTSVKGFKDKKVCTFHLGGFPT